MNAIVLILSLIISLPTMALAETQKDEKNARETKGLAPEQIQAIRTISRNVLAAKHSQKEDPDLSALRARVKELRQAVEDLQAQPLEVELESIEGSQPNQGETPTVEGQTAKGLESVARQRLQAAKEARQAKRQAARQRVRSALSAMKAQRVKTAKKVGAGQTRRSTLIANATAKVEKLEEKLEALLLLQDTEQAGKLQELLEQMKITKRRTVLPSAANETPTYSTITRHRK